ncbi:hypothetical protein MHBO_004677 [Bonamia ostreae]|uniref:Uncharacterized protein n=1 Tax=Bonamia ostreae TaxID=126728 RepID=A0ABV2ATZ7_9EUKA
MSDIDSADFVPELQNAWESNEKHEVLMFVMKNDGSLVFAVDTVPKTITYAPFNGVTNEEYQYQANSVSFNNFAQRGLCVNTHKLAEQFGLESTGVGVFTAGSAPLKRATRYKNGQAYVGTPASNATVYLLGPSNNIGVTDLAASIQTTASGTLINAPETFNMLVGEGSDPALRNVYSFTAAPLLVYPAN